MGTMFDIVGSLVIRVAIVLITLSMNILLNNTLYQKTAYSLLKQNQAIMTDIMEVEIRQIGHHVTSTPFLIADTAQVKFLADIDNSGVVDTIYYYLGPTSELSQTENPNDRKMYRVLNNGQRYDCGSGVTRLQFQYSDSTGSPTANLSLIKSVNVKLWMELGYTIDGKYPSAYCEANIFPPNL